MREIKFRGRLTNSKRWVEGYYCKSPITDENSGMPPSAGWFFLTGEERHLIIKDGVAFTVNPKTIGQHTGLKDKNGKEIYEGDIVDTSTDRGMIVAIGGYWENHRRKW